MRRVVIRTTPGESLVLHQAEDGTWACPVCGSLEFEHPPYGPDGSPSFEMSACGFEFGFDDHPAASSEAVNGITANWRRWREKLFDRVRNGSPKSKEILENLRNIEVDIGGDVP